MNLRCFRCGGTVLVEPDEDGENIGQCMACSALQPYELVNGDRMTEEKWSFTAMNSDWKAGALAELKKHIEIVAGADTSRGEAEKLHRLLAGFGMTVPDLPWKKATAGGTAAGTRRQYAERWTPEEDDILIARYAQHVTPSAIAAELGRPVGSTHSRAYHLRKRGLIPPKS